MVTLGFQKVNTSASQPEDATHGVIERLMHMPLSALRRRANKNDETLWRAGTTPHRLSLATGTPLALRKFLTIKESRRRENRVRHAKSQEPPVQERNRDVPLERHGHFRFAISDLPFPICDLRFANCDLRIAILPVIRIAAILFGTIFWLNSQNEAELLIIVHCSLFIDKALWRAGKTPHRHRLAADTC